MKSRLMILSLSLAAMLATASLAMANPYGRGPGGWMADIPQEKQEQVANLFREGRQKLYELESRKWAKQAELNAILAAPKPDASKVEAMAKEIGTLSSMVYQERVALQQRILKETGVNLPLMGGPGFGRGAGGCPMMGGSGGGYGPRGGNAQAPCCQ